MALFQTKPEGLGLFLHPAALSFAYVAPLHFTHPALLGEKIAPAEPIGFVLTDPRMPAPKIRKEAVLDRIAEVFRQHGYEGATLSLISKATGLGRASLYHHFPGGKEEMGREIFQHIGEHLERDVLSPLRANAAPEECLKNWTQGLDRFYGGGSQNCLLGAMVLSGGSNRFSREIAGSFRTLIDLLSKVLEKADVPKDLARRRSARAIGAIQGGLVVSRGLENERYFQQILEDLPKELLSAK